MKEILEDIQRSVHGIQDKMHDLDKKQELHNHILSEHHKRSTALEQRMEPVENHVDFVNKLFKLVLGAAAVGSTVASILRLWP